MKMQVTEHKSLILMMNTATHEGDPAGTEARSIRPPRQLFPVDLLPRMTVSADPREV